MTMDDRYLVFGESTGNVRVIDFTTGETLRSISIKGQGVSLSSAQLCSMDRLNVYVEKKNILRVRALFARSLLLNGACPEQDPC